MSDLDLLVSHIRTVWGCELKLTEPEELYSSLACCVIDAVYSISARYESTERTVNDFLRWSGWEDSDERSIEEFLERLEPYKDRWEALASEVFRNRQRTSSKSGILKAEAVYHFAGALKSCGIYTLSDLSNIDVDLRLKSAITAIHGQSSGVSFKYFLMLAGFSGRVKPDRMLCRFVGEALGAQSVQPDVAEELIQSVVKILQSELPSLTASNLDYAIWQYQRNIASRGIQSGTRQSYTRSESREQSRPPRARDTSGIGIPASSQPVLIQCYVCRLGRLSPERLEAIELYVCRECDRFVFKPPPRQRCDIQFVTPVGAFRGGLRTYPNPSGGGEVYVCPDLLSQADGTKISLAKVLNQCGFYEKSRVDVSIENDKWTIRE